MSKTAWVNTEKMKLAWPLLEYRGVIPVIGRVVYIDVNGQLTAQLLHLMTSPVTDVARHHIDRSRASSVSSNTHAHGGREYTAELTLLSWQRNVELTKYVGGTPWCSALPRRRDTEMESFRTATLSDWGYAGRLDSQHDQLATWKST